MKSWSAPELPSLSTPGILPTVFDTGARSPRKLTGKDGTAPLYVCEITTYHATHRGQAATCGAF